jgi:hypothetical protein
LLANSQTYNVSWLQIIHALATLIEQESEIVFEALDGQQGSAEGDAASATNFNYRDEPVALFFILYGLCFQTLLRMINRDDPDSKRTIPVVLDALRKFIRPSISGNAIYKSFVFVETTDLLDRMVLMESFDVQLTVIHIAANLAQYHPSASTPLTTKRFFHNLRGLTISRHVNGSSLPIEGDEITDGIEQLLDLVRILVLAVNQNSAWISNLVTRSM